MGEAPEGAGPLPAPSLGPVTAAWGPGGAGCFFPRPGLFCLSDPDHGLLHWERAQVTSVRGTDPVAPAPVAAAGLLSPDLRLPPPLPRTLETSAVSAIRLDPVGCRWLLRVLRPEPPEKSYPHCVTYTWWLALNSPNLMLQKASGFHGGG